MVCDRLSGEPSPTPPNRYRRVNRRSGSARTKHSPSASTISATAAGRTARAALLSVRRCSPTIEPMRYEAAAETIGSLLVPATISPTLIRSETSSTSSTAVIGERRPLLNIATNNRAFREYRESPLPAPLNHHVRSIRVTSHSQPFSYNHALPGQWGVS